MKRNVFTKTISLVIASMMLTVSACADSSGVVGNAGGAQRVEFEQRGDEKPTGEVVMAKITNIDGDTITVQCAEPMEDGERPEPPEGGERSELPEDGERPELPEDGEMPEPPKNGNMETEMEFDGEELVITLDDSIVIREDRGRMPMKPKEDMAIEGDSEIEGDNETQVQAREEHMPEDENSTISIDDLEVGDIINIRYEDDEIKEISKRNMDMPKLHKDDVKPEDIIEEGTTI